MPVSSPLGLGARGPGWKGQEEGPRLHSENSVVVAAIERVELTPT